MTQPRMTSADRGRAQNGVRWFGQSGRRLAGRADTRYGWLETPAGPCIVKALDTEQVPYAALLLEHERRALARLLQLGAPVPALVDARRPDWIVTRFAGLSLEWLNRQPAVAGAGRTSWSVHEEGSTWVHLMRRLSLPAAAGVLALDLHPRNVVVPLADGLRGQLQLHEVAVIDHAHTLIAGMGLQRPPWLQAREQPPEVRAALLHDQTRFRRACVDAGVGLPGPEPMPPSRRAASRRFWAEYRDTQLLQQQLDDGTIRADAATQYAVGCALATLVKRWPSAAGAAGIAVRQVAERLIRDDPAARYPTLEEASDALATALGRVALVGGHRHGPVHPGVLVGQPRVNRTPKRDRQSVLSVTSTWLRAACALAAVGTAAAAWHFARY